MFAADTGTPVTSAGPLAGAPPHSGTGGPAPGPTRAEADAATLSVSSLTVRIGPRTILDDVSFTLRNGEFTGLIGSNGAGKTTLLRAILGLQAPTAGSVVLGGQVGYVPQKFLLDVDMPLRGRDLVSLGLDGHKLGLPRPSASRRARVQEMLEAVGAEHFADNRVGRLSGGEQQRILIAHALVSRPRLLLLDEPLANLDLRSAGEIVALLERIAREQQISVLISAHDMNPMLSAMDRVVYIADGRAVSGTTDEVIRSEVLTRLYRHHVDVLRVHGRVIVVAGDNEHGAHLTVDPCGDAPGGGVERI
jgi:zinc/manganese transport system ATP-binding protein